MSRLDGRDGQICDRCSKMIDSVYLANWTWRRAGRPSLFWVCPECYDEMAKEYEEAKKENDNGTQL